MRIIALHATAPIGYVIADRRRLYWLWDMRSWKETKRKKEWMAD